MKTRLAALAATTMLTLVACAVPADTDANGVSKDAIPQASSSSSSSSSSSEAAPAAEDEEPAPEPEPKATTCDIVREAILTGTKAELAKALKALQADKKADATAREYARYYLGRDAKDPDMREADLSLIQMSCSI